MSEIELTLQVNGQKYTLPVPVNRTLLSVLRDDLGLFGAREGCGIGICGACTVLVAGRALSSCLMLAVQAEGVEIITIEGLAQGDDLHPVQQAYLEHAGFR